LTVMVDGEKVKSWMVMPAEPLEDGGIGPPPPVLVVPVTFELHASTTATQLIPTKRTTCITPPDPPRVDPTIVCPSAPDPLLPGGLPKAPCKL